MATAGGGGGGGQLRRLWLAKASLLTLWLSVAPSQMSSIASTDGLHHRAGQRKAVEAASGFGSNQGESEDGLGPYESIACRASGLRMSHTLLGTVEPMVAGSDVAPCSTKESGLVGQHHVATSAGAVEITVALVRTVEPRTAESVITRVFIDDETGRRLVEAKLLSSTASGECKSQDLTLFVSSRVDQLWVLGNEIANDDGRPQTISVTDVGQLLLNHETLQITGNIRDPYQESSATITRAALIFRPATSVTGDVVIGESTVKVTCLPIMKPPPPCPPDCPGARGFNIIRH